MKDLKHILNQQDISELMIAYNYFHDSCIVSANYSSGSYVDEKKRMNFGKSTLELVFNSQCSNNILKLYFNDVIKFNINSISDAIYSSTIKFENNNVLWIDDENITKSSNFAISKQLSWVLE